VIGTKQRLLHDNTQHSQLTEAITRWDSNPQ